MALAMIFPGQGSQSIGMLGELATTDDARFLSAQASEVLGYDVFELIEKDPEGKLNQTEFTQPALLVSSVIFYRHWFSFDGPKPAVMVGHSLGEWSALVCAGAIDFIEAVKLVQKRGEFMQQAGEERPGGMAAILGMDDAKVVELCAQVQSGKVVAANYNSPGQVVVSGDVAAVDEVVAAAKPAGAKLAKKLAVSVASHSPLMQSAADRFADLLAAVEFNKPSIPVLHNVDVATHSDSDSLRSALVAQLVSPVRWVECMARLTDYTIDKAVECGPGKVLTGLSKRIKPVIPTQPYFNALATLKGE